MKKRFLIICSVVVVILLFPLIASQFTDEVNWTSFDYLIAAFLLFSTGLTLNFILKKVRNVKHRILLSVVLIVGLLLIWAELAVGIFGTPLAGN
ncbi:MAG: hypothetical protein HKN92_07680 [Chitinophagales bacterium]|nr:hypothetical protein [Chitinophagales bacterium]